jgi:Domain of unknown function DUF29
MDATLYDTDFAAWGEQQARLLRQRAELANSDELDWLNLAADIEGVVAQEKREVRSRLALIVQHLLKWRYQPELRSRSWESTLLVQRRDLSAVLEDSPSLRPFAERVLDSALDAGRYAAEREPGLLHLPASCRWTVEEVLDPEFVP